MSWLKYAGRLQRKMYQRNPSANNSFACTNLYNNQLPDPVKPGRAWLLMGWEFRLIGVIGTGVVQVDTAIHLCPPGTPNSIYPEGLLSVPNGDVGTMQLEFGFQTSGVDDVGGSFLGSTTAKWPLIVPEGWFVGAYAISNSNGSLTPTTALSLKLLIVDVSLQELCHM